MSSKQPPRDGDDPAPVSAAVAILEFGRLLHQEDQRHLAGRNPKSLQEAEEKLISRLSTDKNSALKSALDFNAGKPIDPLTLRVLAIVGYIELCTNRLAVSRDLEAHAREVLPYVQGLLAECEAKRKAAATARSTQCDGRAISIPAS